MKAINKIIIIGLFAFFFVGCNDLMDYDENTDYTKEQTFSSLYRVQCFVSSIYMRLESGLSGYNSGGVLASACDEAQIAWSSSNVNYFFNGAWSSLNTLTGTWSNSYAGIRAANYYLEHWNDYGFEKFSLNKDYNDQKERLSYYEYEVRFLRAYFYFNLVKTYGDVPLVTKVLTDEEANNVTRAPYSEVFDYIVSQCDSIADKLPYTYANLPYAETGRVTKLAVLALKARTLLYAASPLFNTSGDKSLWKKAAIASKELIEEATANGCSLGNYTDLWGADNYKAKEVILAKRLGDTNQFEYNNFPKGVEGGYSGNCPSQTLVDAYRMKETGKLWNEDGSGYDAANPYAGRDPRFEMTIAHNGTTNWPAYNENPIETFEGGLNGLPIAGATNTGYYLKKYCDGSIDLRPGKVNKKKHAWVIFRLGEFYLNYAEAMYCYLGDPDATEGDLNMSARDAINVIRNRSDVKMSLLETGLGDSFETIYRNERMVEMAFEDQRFWDVRRWKIGDTQKNINVMSITKENGILTYTRKIVQRSWDDKMYFFPIPDSEIRKNPNLKQNLGWTL